MRTLRIMKVFLYPAAAVFQFFVLPWWFAAIVAAGLLGLAGLNLSQLLSAREAALKGST